MAMVVDYNHLLQQCSNGVHPVIMHGIISHESSFNPYAIGVVGGRLARQPASKAEAVGVFHALQSRGMNFSVGLAQVNKQHFRRFGFTAETAFEPCANVKAGALIFRACHDEAKRRFGKTTYAIEAALSCYYSGNFTTGFKRYGNDKKPYVTAVTDRMLTYNNRPSTIGEGIRHAAATFQYGGKPPIKTADVRQAQPQGGAVPVSGNSAPAVMAEAQPEQVAARPFVTGSRNNGHEDRKSNLLF